jgi:hypothetical protein
MAAGKKTKRLAALRLWREFCLFEADVIDPMSRCDAADNDENAFSEEKRLCKHSGKTCVTARECSSRNPASR